MDQVLIVSSGEKSTEFLKQTLKNAFFLKISVFSSCASARREFYEHDYDLVIINAPLADESGEEFARFVASKGMCQVILIVKSEFYDEVSAMVEDDGVLTISKPLNKAVFWSTLKLAKSTHNRVVKMQAENRKLKEKIEDIKIVDRAKCILISYMSMTEQDAHRYIEKQAMDMRESKRKIAEGILKTYEY